MRLPVSKRVGARVVRAHVDDQHVAAPNLNNPGVARRWCAGLWVQGSEVFGLGYGLRGPEVLVFWVEGSGFRCVGVLSSGFLGSDVLVFWVEGSGSIDIGVLV